MPRGKAIKGRSKEKPLSPKLNPPDMDLGEPGTTLQQHRVARPEPANVHSATNAKRLTPTNPNPGRSNLTDQQRSAVIAYLAEKTPPALREIARRTGATYAAVKHLADQTAIEAGSLATVRLNAYERRLGKRLPVRERVEVYAAVVRGEVEGSRAADRLRALERIEALEGIVTAREQRESESNQVHVGPLFVLPAAAAPVTDAIEVSARRSQDES